MEMISEVYTNSVSSKYTLEPIHRMMKSMGTTEGGEKTNSFRINYNKVELLVCAPVGSLSTCLIFALFCAASTQCKCNNHCIIIVHVQYVVVLIYLVPHYH